MSYQREECEIHLSSFIWMIGSSRLTKTPLEETYLFEQVLEDVHIGDLIW